MTGKLRLIKPRWRRCGDDVKSVASLSRNAVLWNRRAEGFHVRENRYADHSPPRRRRPAPGRSWSWRCPSPMPSPPRPSPPSTSTARPAPVRVQGQGRGAGMGQRGLPVREEALFGQHAGPRSRRPRPTAWSGRRLASSAPGKQGYFSTARAAKAWMNARGAKPTTLLLDPRAWWPRPTRPRPPRTCSSSIRAARSSTRAPSTIRPAPSSRSLKTAKNYVAAALVTEGGPHVAAAYSQPYGVLGEVQGRAGDAPPSGFACHLPRCTGRSSGPLRTREAGEVGALRSGVTEGGVPPRSP